MLLPAQEANVPVVIISFSSIGASDVCMAIASSSGFHVYRAHLWVASIVLKTIEFSVGLLFGRRTRKKENSDGRAYPCVGILFDCKPDNL